MVASAATPAAGTQRTLRRNPATLSITGAPLGNATLSIVSGLPAQPGTPNPLAGRPYVLLRDSYANALAKAGVTVPPGMSPYKYVGTACVRTEPPTAKRSSTPSKPAPPQPSAPTPTAPEPSPASPPEPTTS